MKINKQSKRYGHNFLDGEIVVHIPSGKMFEFWDLKHGFEVSAKPDEYRSATKEEAKQFEHR